MLEREKKQKIIFLFHIMFYCSCVAAALAAWVGEASGETSGETSTAVPGDPGEFGENPRRRPRGAPGHFNTRRVWRGVTNPGWAVLFCCAVWVVVDMMKIRGSSNVFVRELVPTSYL